MLEYHINEKHHFEENAYRKAIAQLKNSREKITVVEDLKKIKNLGSSISGKIKEILLTGKIRKAEFLKNNDEKNVICASFMKIHGIGIVAANNLYKKGYRTIEDLRNHLEDLNSTQKIGLKYYEDIQLRIPREECEEIFNKIKEELLKILPENIIEIVLCGSYRRGKSSCGDMDILITRKDNSGIDGILSSLITSLKEIGLVKETFTNLKTSHDNYVFMGMMQLKESLPNRRVDIKVYKRECFAFALLYFTGSAYFNRSMRLLANKLGFSLSDQGLVKVNRIKNEKIPIGENIECSTEEDIFKALGLSYKTPSERDI
jgi:DNA polymerase lambda